MFGSHVANVLRRLRRIADAYGAAPVVVAASATSADPAGTVRRLAGVEAVAVTQDGGGHGATRVVLWQPPLLPDPGERGAPVRRGAVAETTDLLAALAGSGVRTLAFVGSRRAAEVVAAGARGGARRRRPHRCTRGGAGRRLPRRLPAGGPPAAGGGPRDGTLSGLATTSALELGIDVQGLDAVLICGWPGRLSSFWQQAGRAGRAGHDAVVVLVARDDPLDTYLLHHPEAVTGRSLDATVLDPDNPYVLAPHLCAAAAELPLRPADLDWFGAHARDLVDVLVRREALRRRPNGWYWTRPERAGDLVDLRGTGGDPVRVVEEATGRVLGTVDAAASHSSAHPGAVHVHQGRPYLVRALDLDEGLALVEETDSDVTTQARDVSDVRLVATSRSHRAGAVSVGFGTVDVTSQVVAYLTRDARTGRVLGQTPLDLPPRTPRTKAVRWTVEPDALRAAGLPDDAVAGAAHAAEHAAIGLLPLVAACDRWDVGGVSTACHPDTGSVTVVVHDAHPGGAGFAERAFHTLQRWLTATRDTVRDCRCPAGCPSCVQSPKCGNGNDPLDKQGALLVLDLVLYHLAAAGDGDRDGGPDDA